MTSRPKASRFTATTPTWRVKTAIAGGLAANSTATSESLTGISNSIWIWFLDQDYLREFSRGYSGFNKSRRDFLQYFGRDIEDSDSNLRINRALLSRNWGDIGFQGLLEYTQNLEYGSNNNLTEKQRASDPTLQRLPELNLHLYQTQAV